MPPGGISTIQYLRGLAALAVLGFHAAERAGGGFTVGAAGVDVFFVISGFIMWAIAAERPATPGQFLVRRLQRIAPLYWAVTLAVAAVAVLVPGSFPRLEVTAEAVIKSLAFIPYRDPQGLIAPLIIPGWTLNSEMGFYGLFAAALLAPARARPWLISAVLAGLVALGAALRPDGAIGLTYTDPVLLEFAAGVWLGKLWSEGRLPSARAGWSLAFCGLAGFAAAGIFEAPTGAARLLVWGLPALMLVAGAVTVEQRQGARDLPPLRMLGDASYSIYLVHALAISVVARGLGAFGVVAGPLLLAGGLVAGVLIGLAVHLTIERPAMRLFRGGLGGRRAAALAARPTA